MSHKPFTFVEAIVIFLGALLFFILCVTVPLWYA